MKNAALLCVALFGGIVLAMFSMALMLTYFAVARLKPGIVASNCWFYALERFGTDPRHSYLVVRLSRHAAWPHVMFAPSIEGLAVSEFKPDSPQRGMRGLWAALLFRGRVRDGVGDR